MLSLRPRRPMPRVPHSGGREGRGRGRRGVGRELELGGRAPGDSETMGGFQGNSAANSLYLLPPPREDLAAVPWGGGRVLMASTELQANLPGRQD